MGEWYEKRMVDSIVNTKPTCWQIILMQYFNMILLPIYNQHFIANNCLTKGVRLNFKVLLVMISPGNLQNFWSSRNQGIFVPLKSIVSLWPRPWYFFSTFFFQVFVFFLWSKNRVIRNTQITNPNRQLSLCWFFVVSLFLLKPNLSGSWFR